MAIAGGAQEETAAARFEPLRPRLVRIAYRMLGSLADAEDIVQEAFLRWLAADRPAVRDAKAYLGKVVTRLCLDHLKTARRRRERYVGTWLPEPMVEAEDDAGDDVTLPLMLALERLSPLERAAFLLHDVFGVGFDEIAAAIGREPAACRQLARRARSNVRAARPRYAVPPARGREIAAAFFAASRQGDMAALAALLSDDVTAYSDGGGRVKASPEPLAGRAAVMARHAALAAGFAAAPSRLVRFCRIDGLPGFISVEDGGTLQTTALSIESDRIVAIYVVRNPEKLARLDCGAVASKLHS